MTNEIRPDQTEPPTFRRSDLRDIAFYKANEAAILDAVRHGRVIDDVTDAPGRIKFGLKKAPQGWVR